jgi:hypothetical protein
LVVRKWLFGLGLAGAAWMALVLYIGSLRLAIISNYPGVYAGRWLHYRGIAPSSELIWMFNAWLVLTSGLEWVIVGLVAWAIARRFSK